MILFFSLTLLFGFSDSPPTRYPAPARLVALGDVHGDLDATRKALRLAGAIDGNDQWIGGKLVVVQTGDQLDRGDDEQAILDLFSALTKQAKAAGGAFIPLNGNHELMNIYADFRYVTEAGFKDFEAPPGTDLDHHKALPEAQRARAAAFAPGSPYALLLAQRNIVTIVGESVFVHGGVLPLHVEYGLEAINNEMRAWLRGEALRPPKDKGFEKLVWTRLYSDNPDDEACQTLSEVLQKLGARRMIVGHTVQKDGIQSYCDGQIWCIDVGMAAHYGGKPAVLEISGDQVTPLYETREIP